MTTIDTDFARRFAQEWLDAWNAHDLERVLAHYTEDFEFSSPLIPVIADEPSGRLVGKAAVAAYWRKGLAMLPDLHFELRDVLVGADSMTLYYLGHRGLVAETFFFDGNGHVNRSTSCYSSGSLM